MARDVAQVDGIDCGQLQALAGAFHQEGGVVDIDVVGGIHPHGAGQ